MSSHIKTVIKIAGPVVVLALAIAAAVALIKSKTPPARGARVDNGALVQVITAETTARKIDLSAKGEVTAATSLVLQSRVPGEVVWVSEKLVIGGLVKKGEPLVKIDRSDYVIAMEQRKINVLQAEANISLEDGQQDVAKREWELFSKGSDKKSDPSLALRGPQKAIAKSNLDSAKSSLKRAQLDLKRTTIRSPMNAYIRAESVEAGQIVSNQTPMATLVGTDTFWVQLSVPVGRLGLIDIPGVNSDTGSPTSIEQDVGGVSIIRKGAVLRLLGDLDPVGRMGRVIVDIKDPLNLQEPAENRGLPMLIGAYVTVSVDAEETVDVVALPRRVLREGNKVHLYNDGKLEISQVDIIWRDDDEVLVRGGVKAGDRVITSKLGAPINAMKLRLKDTKQERAEVQQ